MEIELNSKEIQQLLPHRYPFLFLDSATIKKNGSSALGSKLFTINEWFFQGHFPGHPIVPGVLIIESLAQLVAITYLSEVFNTYEKEEFFRSASIEDLASKVGYLVKSDIKFKQIVEPGQHLEMSAKLVKKVQKLMQFKVSAKVKNTECVEGFLNVSEK